MSRFTNKFALVLAAVLAVVFGVQTAVFAQPAPEAKSSAPAVSVQVPLNVAILIQDDVIPRVGNELGVTRQFITSLPAGSRVMVGYISAGSLKVRQPFTEDLKQAAGSLRIPVSSTAASPYNPYVEVIEALKKFDSNSKNRNVVLLISDGLDTSRGFDSTVAGYTLDLERAVKEANRRNVAIYSFYTPTVGLTSRNRLAASYGQSALNRISDKTGGEAFFQGTTSFVTFDSYFNRLRETLNDRYSRAY